MLGQLGRALGPGLRRFAVWLRKVGFVRLVLTVGSLASLVAGFWTLGLTSGLIALGVAGLILEWAVRDDPPEHHGR